MELTGIDEAVIRAEVEAEIARMAELAHPRELTLDQVQVDALVRLRSAGMQWPAIMAYWRRKGWQGSPHTLRRIYREHQDAAQA